MTDPLKSFEAKLNALTEQHRARTRRELVAIFNDLPEEIVQQPALTAAQAHAEFRELDTLLVPSITKIANVALSPTQGTQATTSPIIPMPRATPITNNIRTNFALGVQAMDEYLLGNFELHTHTPNQLAQRSDYANNTTEFVNNLATQIALSPAQMRTAMRHLQANHSAHKDVLDGVYIPGYGMVVHGTALGAFSSADEAWRDSKGYAKLVRTLAEHRLGRGFILEFTALGAANRTRRWWQANLLPCLGLPEQVSGLNQVELMHHAMWNQSSMFTRSGWRHFITDRVTQHFDRAIPEGFTSIGDFLDMSSSVMEELGLKPLTTISKVISFFLRGMVLPRSDLQDARILQRTVQILHRVNLASRDWFKQKQAEEIGVLIGRLILRRIESQTSTVCVPSAVILALGCIQADVAPYPDALSTPDTRLVMLAILRDSGLSSGDDLRRAAMHQWKIA